MEGKPYIKKPSLLQDFQSMIDSTLASESDLRSVRPPSSLGMLGSLLSDIRTSLLLSSFSSLQAFPGHQPRGQKSVFDSLSALNSVRCYGKKALSHTLAHWKRQTDHMAQIDQIQSAADMIARMNAFSKHFMACTVLHNLHKAKSVQIVLQAFQKIRLRAGQPNPLKEVSFSSINCFTQARPEPSLLPDDTVRQWTINGVFKLHSAAFRTQIRLKETVFKRLTLLFPKFREPVSVSEALERLEFEKAELTVNLQNKTNEVNRLVDMLEECKGWETKISHIESNMKTDSDRWKKSALDLQDKLAKTLEELKSLQTGKRAAEQEALDAVHQLQSALEETEKLRKQLDSTDTKTDFSALQTEKAELMKTVEELKTKLQEQIQETLDSEKEKLILLKQMSDKPGKKSVSLPKKTMQLERKSDVAEGQLALEIVRLNRELNKYKFEMRTAIEGQKKAEAERDELLRQIKVKNDSLEKIRKENDQLAVSLSTDQYKSVQKLEAKIGKLQMKNRELSDLVGKMEAEQLSLQTQLGQTSEKANLLEAENGQIRDSLTLEKRKSEEQTKALQALNSLQDRFLHLKEWGDKQISLIDAMKREKACLEEQNDGLKASSRAVKMHMDKAASDADAYAKLLKQMEARLADCLAQKQLAEDEVRTLRTRLSKALTTP